MMLEKLLAPFMDKGKQVSTSQLQTKTERTAWDQWGLGL